MNNVKPTLCLKKISKSFKQGSQNLEVLKGVSLDVAQGEVVSIVGAVSYTHLRAHETGRNNA